MQVFYDQGVSGPGGNSSARITKIEDVRAVEVTSGDWKTYTLTYSYGTNDTFPHLRTVTNHINSGERYNLYYWPVDSPNGFPVTSPWG